MESRILLILSEKIKKSRVLKLFGNKKDIGANGCNELCTALEENITLAKLVFEFCLQQHRGKMKTFAKTSKHLERSTKSKSKRK
ncbi:hypothetical protein RFI_33112 [Reticulomyxa filosa]|uniref:Uncharacterized protein n=1 Tax=Reticulomyxa filosa TaxID=46433 RepID=X6LU81_RETFI|nr:hypothetical protein RFI_33112 [Reticulomyxa filosa]|eukprot:ETO04285.1 hypothetical protein RFI_33112 [Reticulomyxa filosa]